MKPQEWRQKLGDCVRDLFLSPEMKHFYSIPMTTERARIYLLQLSLYVRQRRNFWPQVAANCPEFEVKQRIMELTLTPELKITDSLVLRGEFRIDQSDQGIFTRSDGATTRKYQPTLALNAIYVF